VAKPERKPKVEKPDSAEPASPPGGTLAASAPPSQRAPDDHPAPDSALSAGLGQEEIQRVLGTGHAAVEACLRDPWRGLDQPLGARQVTVRFTVAPEGTVLYPTIDDVTIASAPVGQCLKSAVRTLRFPAFRGDPVKVDAPVAIPAR
jgi:hypothetical protein